MLGPALSAPESEDRRGVLHVSKLKPLLSGSIGHV